MKLILVCKLLILLSLNSFAQMNSIKVKKKTKDYDLTQVEGTWLFQSAFVDSTNNFIPTEIPRNDTLIIMDKHAFQNIIEGVVYEGNWSIEYDKDAILEMKIKRILSDEKAEFAIPDSRMRIKDINADTLRLQTYINCDKLVNFNYVRQPDLKKKSNKFKIKNSFSSDKFSDYFNAFEDGNCPRF
jgi:hypothetical protein